MAVPSGFFRFQTCYKERITAKKYKYTTVKQVGGDDGYCWAVFVNGKEKINGLTRPEVAGYRQQFEREEEKRRTVLPPIKKKRSTLTVAQLIEKLKEFGPDRLVYTECPDTEG